MASSISFQTAVVIGAFFGLAVMVFAKFTKSTRYTILMAVSLTLTQSVYFLLGSRNGGRCDPYFPVDFIFGSFSAVFLMHTIFTVHIVISRTSTAERIRRLYLDAGIPLQGTVVQKSFQVGKKNNDSHTHHTLHIQYDLRPYCSSRNNCEALELGAIGRKNTIETSKTHPKVSPSGLEYPSSSVQWSWNETLNTVSETVSEQEKSNITVDHNRWMNYGDGTNSLLETSFQEKRDCSPIIMDCCTVDFSAMTQTNVKTGLRSKVKRTTPLTIYPFEVDQGTYNESQIGDSIELIWLPGIPTSVVFKSKVDKELDHCGNYMIPIICFGFFCWPLPLMLGSYLPALILNWENCKDSVIVRLSGVAFITLTSSGCCSCCSDFGSVTASQAQKRIKEERDKIIQEFADDEELQQICDAALTFLKKEVLHSLDTIADRNHEWKLVVINICDFSDLIKKTLYQAKVSSGRCIPYVMVVREQAFDGCIPNVIEVREQDREREF
jgi:hypothetical protein